MTINLGISNPPQELQLSVWIQIKLQVYHQLEHRPARWANLPTTTIINSQRLPHMMSNSLRQGLARREAQPGVQPKDKAIKDEWEDDARQKLVKTDKLWKVIATFGN